MTGRAKSPTMKIERVPIDSVKPLERNPRRGDVEFVRASLQRFGQYVPILVRTETGEILKGNHTWHAALEEGLETIEIVRRSVPDDDEAQRLALTDNRASDLADWDLPELGDILSQLGDLEGTGFAQVDLDNVLAQVASLQAPEAGETPDPPAPDRPKRPKTRRGDLIILGEHRLLCGDALDPDDAKRVLDGIEPLVIHADPPYGIEFDPTWRDKAGLDGKRHADLKTATKKAQPGGQPTAPAERSYADREAPGAATSGDTLVDYSPAFALCPSAIVVYVWHADKFGPAIVAGLESIGLKASQMLVWDKEQFVLGRAFYHWQHECCWIARRPGTKVPFYGERNQSTVIRAPSPKRMTGPDTPEGKWGHANQKPLATAMPALANHLLPGQWAYDPFAGSGTTLIAGEHLDRPVAAVEIDPGYCDLIVERWETLTGEKAQRPARTRKPTPRKEKK